MGNLNPVAIKYFVAILMFFSVDASAQTNCDSVIWSATKKLQPSDFKDVADTRKTMIAFTQTKFAYKVFPQEGSVIINTSTIFYPCDSWLNKANIKGSIVHEQLHFDIAEYHKRLFLKRVSEAASSESMFATITKTIFRDIIEKRKAMNMEYDEQTDNGQNEMVQWDWNRKIAALLTSLEKYNANTTTINLK